MPEQNEPFYRTGDIAEMMKVDQRTITRWIRAGEIKAVKLNPFRKNSPYIVKESELKRFLDKQQQGI